MNRWIALCAFGAISTMACKKEVKPEEAPVTAATVPPPVASLPPAASETAAPLASSVAPLASIAPPKHAAPAKPKVDPKECVEARVSCAHPAVGVNPKVKALCDQQKDACVKAGGKM